MDSQEGQHGLEPNTDSSEGLALSVHLTTTRDTDPAPSNSPSVHLGAGVLTDWGLGRPGGESGLPPDDSYLMPWGNGGSTR